jgi:hypothetical protein
MTERLPLLGGLALEVADEAPDEMLPGSGNDSTGGAPSRPVPQLQQLSKLSSHSSLHFGHFHMVCPFDARVAA